MTASRWETIQALVVAGCARLTSFMLLPGPKCAESHDTKRCDQLHRPKLPFFDCASAYDSHLVPRARGTVETEGA